MMDGMSKMQKPLKRVLVVLESIHAHLEIQTREMLRRNLIDTNDTDLRHKEIDKILIDYQKKVK